jgi:hypothetical protein
MIENTNIIGTTYMDPKEDIDIIQDIIVKLYYLSRRVVA